MRIWLVAVLALLTACRDTTTAGAGGAPREPNMPVPPADAQGVTNVVPERPAPGTSRPGVYYDIYLQSPTDDDEQIAMTVFEPSVIEGGKTYPLILDQHGFGGSRKKDLGNQSPTTAVGGGIDIRPFVETGYGVISLDQRGHGESGGTIRAMDPDYEGKNLVAILDWAEVNLDWVMRAPDLDGRPDNMVVGAVGASYGGGFQLVLHAIDPRHRLDALIPHITWNDLADALLPNHVIKMAWVDVLFAVGEAAGSGIDRGHMDPYMVQSLIDGIQANSVPDDLYDFYHYHSLSYFCGGRSLATNGGHGTTPLLPPMRPGGVNVMLWQGMRDTLFDFNQAWRNYECLKNLGGDVRLLTYQGGHNSLLVVPDPGALVYQETLDGGAASTLERSCGETDAAPAMLAFFDEHLKGIPGAADAVPTPICVSLGADDRVLVDEVLSGEHGTPFDVPPTTVVAGVIDTPVVADLGYVVPEGGAVLAGIPYAELTVGTASDALGEIGDPIVFAGVGRYRVPVGQPPSVIVPPLAVDLLDNQITPLRGYGPHRVDLVGIGERLNAGDRLVLLIYGGHDQYHTSGSLNIAEPTPLPVSVSGKVWMPLL